MQCEEKQKCIVVEFPGDMQIPTVRRESASLEVCSKDVTKQHVMRLDEMGKNCSNPV